MNRSERIHAILTQRFQPIHMELRDVSQSHAGHAGARPGGQTHYELVIASVKFNGLTKVQCHQAIYAALAEELKTGLHALTIRTTAQNIPASVNGTVDPETSSG